MLLTLFAIFSASELKISHANARLPFRNPATGRIPHFTISAEGNCVTWTSLDPEIVKVTPIYESLKCSKSANVEVVAVGPTRRSTEIIAESPGEKSLKCDVFIDSIKSLSILTTTRSIYVESSLETLYLQAFDSENNIFTSLDGIPIQWKIDESHLRTIDISNAKLTSPSSTRIKASATLIIQGSQIGKTWAGATIDNLKANVNLIVVEPIGLFPQPIVRVLPHTHIPFELCSTRGISKKEVQTRCVSKINLPSKLYHIQTSDKSVMTVNDSAYATIHSTGTATITAIDNNLTDNTATSLVISSYPSKAIQDEQYIALGDTPVFDPIIFDRDGMNYDMFEKSEWKVIGDWSTVGRKEITLQYYDYSFIAIVHVCPPLTVNPKHAVLPVDYKGYPVSVTGGSGNISYRVEPQGILDYSNGFVNTHNTGTCKIVFYDRIIQKYTAYSEIIVSRIDSIDIQLQKRELITERFQPKCSVMAPNHLKFSVEVPIRVQSSNVNVVSNEMIPLSPGFSDIYCVGGGATSEKIKVSVASNLNADVRGIASPNSPMPLRINGGVLRWPQSNDSPTININCPNTHVSIYDHYHFSVDQEYSGICTLTMQNQVTSYNPIPLIINTTFNVEVKRVSRFALHLIDQHKRTYSSQCNFPYDQIVDQKMTNDNFNIQLNHPYALYVYALDNHNNIINYYSADKFDVRSSTQDQIRIENEGRIYDTDWSTRFSFIPTQDSNLSIYSGSIPSNIIQLRTISDYQLEGKQLRYFKKNKIYEYPIHGGSGLFETDNKNAHIRNSQLILNTDEPGSYRLGVRDICSADSKQYDLNLISVTLLKIIAPTTIPVNTEFEVTVLAYIQNGEQLPSQFYEDADIQLHNVNARKVGPNKWIVNSTNVDLLTIEAVAENGVKAQHYVYVIQQIVATPQYIELLPGERQAVTIVNGPTNVKYTCSDESIAQFDQNINEVVAISPGKMVINISAVDVPELPHFIVYVTVLQPVELKITPSTNHVIQYGYLILRLSLLTNDGIREIKDARWSLSNEFRSRFYNLSYVIIDCNEATEFHAKVEAYELTASYSTNIEPKLKLISPSQVSLPTDCTYRIAVENDLHCQFTSLDETIITIDNAHRGVIQSTGKEGDAIVRVTYEHQTVAVTIRVSIPKEFFAAQVDGSLEDYNLKVLTPYGTEYTTTECFNYELYATDTVETNNELSSVRKISESTTPNGRIFTLPTAQFVPSERLMLQASVINKEYVMRNTFSITSSSSITPKKPLILQGYWTQMKCNAKNRAWSVSDSSIATISNIGVLTARRAGITEVSCAHGVSTTVQVINIQNIELKPDFSDSNARELQYKINFDVSTGSGDTLGNSSFTELIKPNDVSITCGISSRSGCAQPTYIQRNNHHYCILTLNEGIMCPPNSNVIATLSSKTLGLHLSSQIPITKNTDFKPTIGHSSTIHVALPTDTRKVELLVNVVPESVEMITTPGLSAVFVRNDDALQITADDTFVSPGQIVLVDKATHEKKTIDVFDSSNTLESPRVFQLDPSELRMAAILIVGAIIIYLCIISFWNN